VQFVLLVFSFRKKERLSFLTLIFFYFVKKIRVKKNQSIAISKKLHHQKPKLLSFQRKDEIVPTKKESKKRKAFLLVFLVFFL
jgi:hypothetical protein